jgi:hypothetical protein
MQGMSSKSMWTGLQQRMLPGGKWFGVLDARRLARGRTPEEGMTTGSIARDPAQPAVPPASEPAAIPENSTQAVH